MKKKFVVLVNTSDLIPNPTKLSIYQEPENYNSIRENIKNHGIIEPLIVNKKNNIIISGNLRYQIALELGIDKILVIFEDIEDVEMDITSISTNQTRVKSYSEILKELEFFEQHYNVKKGQRTDLNPDLQKLKRDRDEMLASIPRDTRNKLKNISKMASELFGKDSEDYNKIFQALDAQKATLNSVHQNLADRLKRIKNDNMFVGLKMQTVFDNFKLYNSSSKDMFHVKDETINAIITSPPYFQMKDYGTGKSQMGLEKDVDSYLSNLVEVFQECHRVLRQDGSLFVNINDCVIDGKYQAVPQKFVIEMLKIGWLFNDEFSWIKNNPTYSKGKRSVRSHEPIFHFVKSDTFFYNDEWLKDLADINNSISYGTNNLNPKVISGLDFRDGILRTNVSNTGELRNICETKGFFLTHSATFPVDVPTICLLLSTKENDTVLDCFAGTSTVGQVAIENNRKYIGYELNVEYVQASNFRIFENKETRNKLKKGEPVEGEPNHYGFSSTYQLKLNPRKKI